VKVWVRKRIEAHLQALVADDDGDPRSSALAITLTALSRELPPRTSEMKLGRISMARL